MLGGFVIGYSGPMAPNADPMSCSPRKIIQIGLYLALAAYVGPRLTSNIACSRIFPGRKLAQMQNYTTLPHYVWQTLVLALLLSRENLSYLRSQRASRILQHIDCGLHHYGGRARSIQELSFLQEAQEGRKWGSILSRMPKKRSNEYDSSKLLT